MIKGIGIDIVEVNRIRDAVLKNKGFLEKICSKSERDYIKSRNYNHFTIAGLFSAKEAVSKALGTGIRGFSFESIEITHDSLGKPEVKLKDEALKVADKLGINSVHLSISHDKEKTVTAAVAESLESIDHRVMDYNFKGILPKRDDLSHKGTYGRIGVMGGKRGMSGAPFLSSSSALRTGSGIVYTLVPSSIREIIEIKSVEAIVESFYDYETGHFLESHLDEILDFSNKLDALAIGPGIGVDRDRVRLVESLLENVEVPVVLDADGLNCIRDNKDVLKKRQALTVLTPHLIEFKRLLGHEISLEEIQLKKTHYAKEFAKEYGIVLVLKGHETIVSNGEDVFVNSTGNPGMATAGSGDVLTGIITSLIGQGLDVFLSAKIGVYVHGLAGDIARDDKGEYGLIATDIINSIPYAIKILEGEKR